MNYKELLHIQCEGNTSPMAVYLYNYLKNYGKLSFDESGNLWFERGNVSYFPLIVAHMDTVQQVNFSKTFTEKKNIVSGNINGKSCGIGADDKNGIYVAVSIIEQTDLPLKCLFTHGEETGTTGARETNKEDFIDIGYMVQFDRMGKGDIIDYGSEKFLTDVEKIGVKYGYKETPGLFTDVTVLSQRHLISAVNLSCGYYGAHGDHEVTNLRELENAVKFGIDLLTNLSGQYPYEYELPTYKYGAVKYDNFGLCDWCGKYDKLSYNFETGGYVCPSCKEELKKYDVPDDYGICDWCGESGHLNHNFEYNNFICDDCESLNDYSNLQIKNYEN